MINKIVIGFDSSLFNQNKILDVSWIKKYPGMSWIPILHKIISDDFEIVTSDVALSRVNAGQWAPNSIAVIQHQVNELCSKLIDLGAYPLIIMAMESPLYSSSFLRDGKKIGNDFKARIMLTGFVEYFSFSSGENHSLRFPSFHSSQIMKATPWDKKKFIVAFMKNMYANYFSLLYFRHPIDILRVFYRFLKKIIFFKFTMLFIKKFKAKGLHNERLEAIIFFLKKNKLDLFGSGWNNLSNLPSVYRKKLSIEFKKNKPYFFEDKLKKINEYKFCLCYENASYIGGFSEKVIHCFVAGVIPVYLGAVDVDDFLPKNTFIDVRKFKSLDSLLFYLENIKKTEAEEIINNGRLFLESEEGKKYSYEGFAEFMKTIIINKVSLLNKKFSVDSQ